MQRGHVAHELDPEACASRAHARPIQWLRFVLFDVLTLPFLWIAGIFQGRGKSVVAKGVGIFDGLRKKRVTAESIRAGGSWLW